RGRAGGGGGLAGGGAGAGARRGWASGGPGRRPPAPGAPRHKVPGTFGTRQEAEAVRVRVHAEVLGNNPVIAKPSAITVGQYLADYLDHARATLRPRTLDLYRRTADSWILCPVGTTTPVDISTVTVQALTPGFVRTWYV